MAGDSAVGLAFRGKDQVSPVVRGIRNTLDRFKRDAAAGFGLGAGISIFNTAQRAIGGVVDFLGDAQRAASDMTETQAKLDQVFTASADGMRDWAGDAATAMGMSQRAALESAATLGNFLQAMKLSEDQAAEMSREMVTLAADLASFNNVAGGAEEVMIALRSGLAGETEPMRRLGVDVSAAAVQMELLASGAEKVAGEFSQSQKVAARYRIILGSTRKAQGDFARTADGTANKQRILTATVEDGKAELGRYADAAANAATSLAIDLARGLSDAADLVKGLDELLDPGGHELELVDEAIRALAKDLGLSESALMGFVAAQREAEAQAQRAIKEEQELQLAVEGFRNMLLLTATSADEMERQVAEYEVGLRAAARSTTDVVEVTDEQARITAAATRVIQEFNAYVAAGGDVSRWLASGAGSAGDAIEAAGDEAGDAADEMHKLADGLDIARGAFKGFWKEVREEQRQIRFFITHPGKLRQETDRITARLEDLEAKKAAIEKDGVQRRERLALLAIDGLIQKLRSKQDEYRALGVLHGNAAEAGMEASFDPDLIAEIRQRRLPTRQDVLTHDGIPRRAAGGPVPPYGAAIVGERGPELLTMGGQGGYITPNHQLGGSGPIYLVLDGAVLARSVDRRMGDTWALTRAGGHYRSAS